jgi:hypothetical protein
LGAPGFALKSSSSSFNTIPVPRATIPDPKGRFSDWVADTAFPSLSTMEKWVVFDPSSRNGSPPPATAEARSARIASPRRFAYAGETRPAVGTFTTSGSPR